MLTSQSLLLLEVELMETIWISEDYTYSQIAKSLLLLEVELMETELCHNIVLYTG